MAQDQGISTWHGVGLSRRAWMVGLVLSIVTVVAGFWGFSVEEPTNHAAYQGIAYVLVPILILTALAVGRGSRPGPVLIAVGLMDVEAILIGGGPLVALPFAVAVPLVGLSAAVRVLPPHRVWPPYVAAWVSSTVGIAIAVANALPDVAPSAFIVIPCFAIVDAVALMFLWRLDADRVKAFLAVAAAESRTRDLLEGVELFGVHVDVNSRIDFVNDFALRMTGWTSEEVLGKDWYDTFVTPDRREAARERYRNTASGRHETDLERHRESTILTRSGQARVIRWSHVNRRHADGSFAGVASLGEDVTAVRAVEEEQRRSAEMLATLVVSSPLPTVVMGLDRVVQLWNPAAAELMGWPEAEVLGRPVPPVFSNGDRWAIAERFIQAVHGDSFENEVVQLCRRDGAFLTVRLYGGALRDRDGKPIAVAMQAVDVTSALALEEQLREAQKMEAVGRLAGGVAHDFNNSLTAIGGFASLIASDSKEPESREAAETIMGAAKRAADLTRELLAYSRRSLLQPQTIDVNGLVAGLRPMLLRMLGEDVAVVFEARSSEAVVCVDKGGLERVIINLAANARDAMPGGGRLTITTERRHAPYPIGGDAGRWISIAVADTGSGIPPELHSQVFDPFFTTKPVGRGTGLGLSMVKGFVVQSGGDVSLNSIPGVGTTIEILLPEAIGNGRTEPAAEGPKSAGGEETILVIEDESSVAALSFQVLTRRGYRVLLADSGASAVGLLRSHAGPIALLLVDVILPDIRGPQVAEAAAELHPESAVLFASGYSAEAITLRGELPAAVDLIEKPFAPEELLSRVRSAIDRGPTVAAATPGGPTDPA
jgi:PAS domain S-box-containing protein